MIQANFGYKYLDPRESIFGGSKYIGCWEPTPMYIRLLFVRFRYAWRRTNIRYVFLNGEEYKKWEYATPTEMVAKVLTEQGGAK